MDACDVLKPRWRVRANQNESELTHYGILGMKWGVRRTPEQLGHKSTKKAKSANIERWGSSEKLNTLYITGPSGSGKSTLAKYLANTNDAALISLDAYLENLNEIDFKYNSNKNFNRYLKNKDISIDKLRIGDFKETCRFKNIIQEYSAELYPTKLIVEGAQIGSGYFKIPNDSPLYILNANILTASYRRLKRDGFTMERGKQAVEYHLRYNKKLKAFKISHLHKRHIL